MHMYAPDCLTQAEDDHAERLERKERLREQAFDRLKAEYIAAACVPAIATVSVPTDREPGRRWAFVRVFEDDICEGFTARVVSVLMRSDEGRKLIDEMAEKHARFFADDVVEVAA